MALALLAVATAIMSRAVSDALLLTSHPLSDIPVFFAVSSGIFVIGSLVYSASVRVIPATTLNAMLLSLFALGMVGGRLALDAGISERGVYAICVWLNVAPPLFNIVCWNTIVDSFDSRQGRRLFPIILAASTIGAILSGVAISPFVHLFGLDNLLWVLAVMVGATVPVPFLLGRSARADTAAGRSFIVEGSSELWDILKEGVTSVARSKLLRAVGWTVFLAALVTNLVDFAFKAALQANYGKDEIGIFYGYFNAIASSANLVVQLFVVTWALDRFGVRRAFQLLPIALVLGAGLFGWWPGLISVVAVKFVDGLLRFTFQSAVNEVVIAPIPYVQRNRAKIFIKGVMNPLGAIAAAALLTPFALGRPLDEGYLLVVLLVVLGIWLVVVMRIGRTYADQLYASLRHKQAMRTPHPDEEELFGAGPVDVAMALASSARWESFGEQPALWLVEGPSANTPGHEPGEGPTVSVAAWLTDSSPVVRTNTLEELARGARKGHAAPVPGELLEGLLWRELNLAYALLGHHAPLAEVAGSLGRRIGVLLDARLEDTIYRVFLILGLLSDIKTLKTAYFGLRAESPRTKAHAVDLVDALLDGALWQRVVMLLIEEMVAEARLERAARLGVLEPRVFDDPRSVLDEEHDPQLHRLLDQLAA